MAGLESFSNLSKPAEDLLKKGFCFSQLGAFTLYSKNTQHISHKASIKVLEDNSTTSFTSFTYKHSDLSLKQEIHSSQVLKTVLDYSIPQLKDVKFKAEAEFKENSNNVTVSLEQINKFARTKVALSNALALRLSTVAKVQNDKGVGLDLTVDLSQKKLTGYNFALWWNFKGLYTVLKHTSTSKDEIKFGDLTFYGAYNWCERLRLAGSLNREKDFKLGLEFTPEPGNVFKGRLDSEANFAVSMRTKLSSLVTIVAATHYNMFDNEMARFGLRIKLNQ